MKTGHHLATLRGVLQVLLSLLPGLLFGVQAVEITNEDVDSPIVEKAGILQQSDRARMHHSIVSFLLGLPLSGRDTSIYERSRKNPCMCVHNKKQTTGSVLGLRVFINDSNITEEIDNKLQ
jgi:hypothetical protein